MKHTILLLLILAGLTHANTITVVTQENCPYICKKDKKNKGFLIDIVTHLFNRAGYKLEYTIASSHEQSVEDVRVHKFDAIIGTTPPETPGFIFPKLPLAYSYDVMIVPKYSKWKYRSPSSLDELTLGLEEGRDYNDAINKHIEKNKDDSSKVQLISGKNVLKHNLRKLRFEKVSATIGDRVMLRHFYFQKRKPFVFKVAHTYQTETVYIAFSPQNYKSKQYAEILYKWQQKLKGTQEIKEILQKYGLSEAYIRPQKKID